MIKDQKTMSMEAFVDKILPFTTWAIYDIQKWAYGAVAEDKDFVCIVRDIEFTIPKDSVVSYGKEHGVDNSFANSDEDNAFAMAVSGQEEPKKKPGRPRKAQPGDPLPDEFK